MSFGDDVQVALAFDGNELEGMIIPLPGMTPGEVKEARRLVEAGVEDDPLVHRLAAAFDAGLGSKDGWCLGDEAALRVEIADRRRA